TESRQMFRESGTCESVRRPTFFSSPNARRKKPLTEGLFCRWLLRLVLFDELLALCRVGKYRWLGLLVRRQLGCQALGKADHFFGRRLLVQSLLVLLNKCCKLGSICQDFLRRFHTAGFLHLFQKRQLGIGRR